MNSINLNGTWELSWEGLDTTDDHRGGPVHATVPGDVHLDLMAAGLIEEPLVGLNSTKYRWIEECRWRYTRRFEVPPGFVGRRTELACDGLDMTAHIIVNGREAGRSNNMLMGHRFVLDDLLAAGENTITVELDVGFTAVAGADTGRFNDAWGREEPRRPWMRKAQQAFYWDTAPRLVTCGIWRDIRLEFFDTAILRDVTLRSRLEATAATLLVEAEVENLGTGDEDLVLEVKLEGHGASAAVSVPGRVAPGTGEIAAEVTLENAKLWWPNGMGEAHLYGITVQLRRADGTFVGARRQRHGFRTVEMNRDPVDPTNPEPGNRFTVMVNGLPMFAKGGNYVPADSIYARISREKEFELVRLAAEANCNLMRVWGGGIYPAGWFYDACDEMGILVWQEFMYACAYYPDDEPDFLAEATREAEWAVRQYRNRTSLAMWCGNNEISMMHHRIGAEHRLHGQTLFFEVFPGLIGAMDPDRFYWPSSPYPGPWPGQEIEGDQHVWSYVLGWHDLVKTNACDFTDFEMKTIMKIWEIPDIRHKFLSEFGIFAPSNLSSVRRFLGDAPLALEGEAYQHHRNHFEADFILEMLRRYYRDPAPADMVEFTLAGQMVQAECLKYIFEQFRSRMYECSGVLFWEYNDSWGHVGYAPVDYYLAKKALFWYMKRSFTPVHAIFRHEDTTLVLVNDTTGELTLEVEWGFWFFDGRKEIGGRTDAVVPATGKAAVTGYDGLPANPADHRRGFLFAMVRENGRELSRGREFRVPLNELKVPASALRMESRPVGVHLWEVTLFSDRFEWMVSLRDEEGLFDYTDNDFDIWPGESIVVTVTTDREYEELPVEVRSMNMFRE